MPLPATGFKTVTSYQRQNLEKRVYHEPETQTSRAYNYVAVVNKSGAADALDVKATLYCYYQLYWEGQKATNTNRMWMIAYFTENGGMRTGHTAGSPMNAFEYQLTWLLEQMQDQSDIVIEILKEARKYEEYSAHGSSKGQFLPLLNDDFYEDYYATHSDLESKFPLAELLAIKPERSLALHVGDEKLPDEMSGLLLDKLGPGDAASLAQANKELHSFIRGASSFWQKTGATDYPSFVQSIKAPGLTQDQRRAVIRGDEPSKLTRKIVSETADDETKYHIRYEQGVGILKIKETLDAAFQLYKAAEDAPFRCTTHYNEQGDITRIPNGTGGRWMLGIARDNFLREVSWLVENPCGDGEKLTDEALSERQLQILEVASQYKWLEEQHQDRLLLDECLLLDLQSKFGANWPEDRVEALIQIIETADATAFRHV